MNRKAIVRYLQAQMPGLLAIFAFGSRVQHTTRSDSDLDLALLVAGYADALQLWGLSGDLADCAGCAVDLVDLRAASTVMQYQIITTGEHWWVKNSEVAMFEAMVLSEKTELDTARASLLANIQNQGTVYG